MKTDVRPIVLSAPKSFSFDGVPTSPDTLTAQWARIRSTLREEVGDAAYKSWLKQLTLVDLQNTHLRLAVPTRFVRDWILSRYGDRIRHLWNTENPNVLGIEILVQTSETTVSEEDDASAACEETVTSASSSPLEVMGSLDTRFTFDNFVVGKPNEFAFAAARRVADSPSVPFNPLFLHGGVGLGKTHLMHAIAWEIRKKDPTRNVIYLSAEKFMYQFIRSLQNKNTVAFKDLFRSVDVLMIDDVQFICGKDSIQEEFFHTFNALIDNNRQIILSADKSPSNLEGLEERLRSRLGWGLVADLHPTTYELRLGILQSKAEQIQAKIPLEVLEFLAQRIHSNTRELEGALNRLVAHASLIGQPISLETTQMVLGDLLRASERKLTIEEIQKTVADFFSVRVADMHSPRRERSVARPRQVAMFLAKRLTQRSLPEIGRKFGGRDHTTVMHAVKKVEELSCHDSDFRENLELLSRMLNA